MKFSARAIAAVAPVPQPERSPFLPASLATVATVATVATPQTVCSNGSDCSNDLAAFSSDSTADPTCWWNITVAGKRYRVQFEEPQTLAGLREQHTRRRPGEWIELEPVFSPPTFATTATVATVAPDCSHRSDCSGEPNRKTAVDCSHRSDCSKGASGKNEDFVLAGVAVKPNPGDAAKGLLAAAGVEVEVIRDSAAVPAAVSALLAYRGPVGFDIETAKAGPYRHAPNAGLDPHLSTIRLMQFAADHRAFVFDLAAIQPALLELLFARPLVAHNAGFEMKFCLHAGIAPALLHCTLLMDRVLSGRRRSLAEVAKTALGWALDKTLQTSDWSGVLTAAHYDYAALDAATADRLFPILKTQLNQQRQADTYKLLAAAQRFIAKLERAGCPFDGEGHRRLIDHWQADAEQGRAQLAVALGPGIDPNSPAHLSAWLERQLDPDTLNRWPRTPKGWLSTGKDTLAAFADLPVVAPLVAYKTASKRLNTYGESWLKHRSPATGRIHAGFLIAETKPGRFSCRNPNLQQLPRDAAFRALVKATPGYRLVVADYGQIELRTIALLSGDPTLLAAYRDGKDLHRLTAAAVLGIEPDQVTKGQRQLAKAINFGLIYGMSPATLVSHAKTHYGVAMTLPEAQQAHAAFFRAYPRLRYWQRVTAAETERTLKSPIRGGLVRDFARDGEPYSYTEALNTPVQGAAAMAMLAALPRIDRALVGLDAQPVNLIHDEVVLEVAEADVPAAKTALSAAMVEGLLAIFPDASTRDLVEAHEGDNWEAAKP
ncbi:MAG: DNA polymerase [Candidatus Competibacteraceae bacterium]